jgi:predicted PurR-regulated permease PerM
MDWSVKVPLWILATAAIIFGLFWFADVLTQFALAMILWLVIDGFARMLGERVPKLPRQASLAVALLLVIGAAIGVVVVVADNVGGFTFHTDAYEARLDALAAAAYRLFGLPGAAPTVGDLLARANPQVLVQTIAGRIQALASDAVFIFIYLGFLFAAAATFPAKLDSIFPAPEARERTRRMLTSIRISMERYLWVQTVASVIITALTFVTLQLLGMQNALLWSFIIFFLNYIPTIGSFVAVALTGIFALVQMPSLGGAVGVIAGVGLWQFVIGNFVQPRMTGDSLNLSTLVVLLALAVWGSLWGITGAFLAAPLTVMMMIILAQFPDTRWMAVLLSADGHPEVFAPEEADLVPKSPVQ